MNCCSTKIYIKTMRYTRPNLAPLTIAEEVRQSLIDLTGEEFVQIDAKYCPFCGKKLESEAE